jgi:nucleotide-binding universal stress UspA family protein
MKILLATDGSPFSQAALTQVIRRSYPRGTELRIVSVVHPWPFIAEPTFVMAAAHYASLDEGQKRAAKIVADAAKMISEGASHLVVTAAVLEGSPKERIVEEAERWGADLIMVGSHGYGPVKRFLLGSVAQAVVLHAHCSVEVVRSAPQNDSASPP